jgi:hypothetical protein
MTSRRRFVHAFAVGVVGTGGCFGTISDTGDGSSPSEATDGPTSASGTATSPGTPEVVPDRVDPVDADDVLVENTTGARVSGTVVATREADGAVLLDAEFTLPARTTPTDGAAPEYQIVRYSEVVGDDPAAVTVDADGAPEASGEFVDAKNNKQLRAKIHDGSIGLRQVVLTNRRR